MAAIFLAEAEVLYMSCKEVLKDFNLRLMRSTKIFIFCRRPHPPCHLTPPPAPPAPPVELPNAHKSHLWCKKRQRQLSPEKVLGSPEGVAVFAQWAPATGLFHRRRHNGSDEFGEGEDDGAQE